MKYTLFTTALLVALIFSGCKSKLPEIKIKPKTVTIKGALGKYFEVVDKEYVLKECYDGADGCYKFSVEIKRLDTPFENELAYPNTYEVKSFGRYEKSIDYFAGFGVELMDDNGPVAVEAAAPTSLNTTTQEGIESVIRLNTGETGFVEFFITNNKLESSKSFQVTSAFEKNNK
jgi:hypothetical protein